MTALPPDLREAVETAKRPLDFDLHATNYVVGGDLDGYRLIDHATVAAIIEAINAAKPALALIEHRLMEYCTALEMIRDKRSEGGSKLISGREAEAIASAALPKEKP